MERNSWVIAAVAACVGVWAVACSSDDGSGGGGAGAAGAAGSTATGGTGGTDGGAGTGGASGAAGTDAAAGASGAAGSAGSDAGGGDGGICGPVGGTGTTCEQMCAKTAASGAMCAQEDPAICKLHCEKSLAKQPTCASEAQAVIDCAAGNGCISCPFMDPVLEGCDTQRQAYYVCSACLHDPAETLCTACGKENCCTELTDVAKASDSVPFAQCLDLCNGNAGCSSACKAAYPIAGAATDQYLACLATPCPAACNQSANGTDVVRDWCKAAATTCTLGITQAECEKNLAQASSITGCGEYMWKALECDLQKGLTCDSSTGYPKSDPTCTAIVDSCPHVGCGSFFSPDGSCGTGCGDWKASCQAGGLDCECTFGKNVGKKLTLTKPCDEVALELGCSL